MKQSKFPKGGIVASNFKPEFKDVLGVRTCVNANQKEVVLNQSDMAKIAELAKPKKQSYEYKKQELTEEDLVLDDESRDGLEQIEAELRAIYKARAAEVGAEQASREMNNAIGNVFFNMQYR